MSKFIGEVMIPTGEYDDGGQTKKNWTKIGAAFQDDRGQISIKLTLAPPLKPGNDGYPCAWLSVFAPKPRDKAPRDMLPNTAQHDPAQKPAQPYSAENGELEPF